MYIYIYIYTYTHKPTYTYLSACVLSHFSCVWLCYPMDCDPPGSSVHGILQVRILEWVAMPFLQGIFPTQGLNPHFLHLLHWQADSLYICIIAYIWYYYNVILPYILPGNFLLCIYKYKYIYICMYICSLYLGLDHIIALFFHDKQYFLGWTSLFLPSHHWDLTAIKSQWKRCSWEGEVAYTWEKRVHQ